MIVSGNPLLNKCLLYSSLCEWAKSTEKEKGIVFGRKQETSVLGLPWCQWLGLWAPNAGGPGSVPGQGARSCMPQLKIPHDATKIWCSHINTYFLKNKILPNKKLQFAWNLALVQVCHRVKWEEPSTPVLRAAPAPREHSITSDRGRLNVHIGVGWGGVPCGKK